MSNNNPDMARSEPPTKLLRRPRPPRQVKVKESTFGTNTDVELYSRDSTHLEHFNFAHEGVHHRLTPVYSIQQSLLTPPPSMDPRLVKERMLHGRGLDQRRSKIEPWEKKFVLDPNYNSRHTTAATHSRGMQSSLTKPYKPRGPAPLHPRQPVKRNIAAARALLAAEAEEDDFEERFQKPPPLFTLNSFMRDISNSMEINLERVSSIMLSSHSYKRITELVHQQVFPRNLRPPAVVDVDEDTRGQFQEATNRLPAQQILLEMTTLIKKRIQEATNTPVRCQIRALPKFDPRYKLGEAPHTEILVLEADKQRELDRFLQFEHSYQHPPQETMFPIGGEQHYQDSRRGREPFAVDGDQISPAEVCVLDCIMNGGEALSVKGSFVHQLPDISMLLHTLTYVNISYNNFTTFPAELCLLKQLRVLKMRNNPLLALPMQICDFSELRVLVASFCLIEVVPMTLYSLRELRVLDLSYNRLTEVHNDISNFRKLNRLNLEGNELVGMPPGLLKLRLREIRLRNNFLHPLFWKENSDSSVQRLLHLASLAFLQANLDQEYAPIGTDDQSQAWKRDTPLPELPDVAKAVLRERSRCDCCQGPMFGPGLKIIRPCKKLFGVKMIPILFRSCSLYCLNAFKGSYEQIVSMLYEEEDDNEEEGDMQPKMIEHSENNLPPEE